MVRRQRFEIGGDAGNVVVGQMLHRMNDDVIHAAEGRAFRVARSLQ
jgi:hypothetical protein